jgi:glycosyltransferase involved in cell wall biosynthesis
VAEFLKRFGASSEQLTFIANGVDTDTFHPAEDHQKQTIRRALGLPHTGILALFVGRFVPKKGYCKLLQATSVRYSLVMVGGPPPEDAEDLQGVIFLGTRSPKQVTDVYRACDVFVLPSQSEGFPLTLQEAMASGLPIITSDDPGYDVYGFDRDLVALMPPTVSHIRSALERVAADADLRRRMAKYSLHVATTRFPWSAHARELECIYSDLCSKTKRSRPMKLRAHSRLLLRSLLRTTFLYGTLTWVYIALNSVTHPYTLAMPLTHFASWPLEGDVGSACFAMSAISFLALRTLPADDQESGG